MMIFAGADVESYLDSYKAGKIQWPRACPACGDGRLHKHGHYCRQAELDGQAVLVPIQRMRCCRCKKTCSMLPSVFIPRQSMTTPERERVAAAAARGCRGAA